MNDSPLSKHTVVLEVLIPTNSYCFLFIKAVRLSKISKQTTLILTANSQETVHYAMQTEKCIAPMLLSLSGSLFKDA